MIDTNPPETYMHLHLKLKKLQMEEERHAIVVRDNRLLLEKMAHIIQTRGRVDNRNDYQQRRWRKSHWVVLLLHNNVLLLGHVSIVTAQQLSQ